MSSQPPPAPPKPTLPPFWKWLMRITFAVTMVLFLAPAVYVVKYYAVDRPREEAFPAASVSAFDPPQPDYLPPLEKYARGVYPGSRIDAIRTIGIILRQPGVGYKRPLECLSAKATLAELATKDPDPAVRAEASAELGKVAQGGAVIRR
jgi:hypothetical protein